jgi:hypothetical protein
LEISAEGKEAMNTRALVIWKATTFGLAAIVSTLGFADAQQDTVPKNAPPPATVKSTQIAYDSGIGEGLVKVSVSPDDTEIKRFDGVPVQVTAARSGGLIVDLGVMHKTMGADHQWRVMAGKAHTLMNVPIDLTTLRVTVDASGGDHVLGGVTEHNLGGVTFSDRHNHRLHVVTFVPEDLPQTNPI